MTFTEQDAPAVRASKLGPPVSPWDVQDGDAWDLALQVKPESVDVVITSPPYWGLRTYGHEHNDAILEEWTEAGKDRVSPPPYDWYRAHGGVLGLEPFPGWYISHLADIFDRLGPSVKGTGSIWVNLGDTYFGRWSSIREEGRQGLGGNARRRRVTPSGGVLHDKQLLMIPAKFAIEMQERGWILRNDVIWHKPHTPPRPEKDRLRVSHEHFFHFVKRSRAGRPTYFYDLTKVEVGSTDVITVGPDRSDSRHSATFPLALVTPRIESSSPAGGLVLDPFCGTGTSLVAAVNSGRRGLGFELSKAFAQDARIRLSDKIPSSRRGDND